MNAARLSATTAAIASICFNNSSSMGTWMTLLLLFFGMISPIKLCNLTHIRLHNVWHLYNERRQHLLSSLNGSTAVCVPTVQPPRLIQTVYRNKRRNFEIR